MNDLFINARFRVRKNVIMHVNRKIPGGGKGKINVVVGRELTPEDILGEGESLTGFITINLAKELADSPKTAFKRLKRKIGERIYFGEPLAVSSEMFGLRKRVFLSPSDGILDFYDNQKGLLRIKLFPRLMKMASGMFGIVDKIDSSTGTVTLRCMAHIIYGVLGSGKEREGILKVIGSPEALISSKQIESYHQNQIIVGGSVVFLDALEKALGLHVNGIITGGINAIGYKSMVGGRWNVINKKWSDVGITLLTTEGFGSIPIGEDIFSLLKEYDGRFGIIDGNRGRIILPSSDPNSMMYVRGVRLPQGSYVETEAQISIMALKVGSKVRVVAPERLGAIGAIEDIDQSLTTLPSGVKTFMVKVKTQTSKIVVPYPNLEAII